MAIIELFELPSINTPTIIKKLIAHVALNLHSLSLWIAAQVNYNISVGVGAQHDVPTKYTGPTYGKIANTARQQILTHEKCTGSTGWLYTTIVCLINRRTNTLETSLPQLAIETGMTEPTILRHTKYLEQLGLLSVERDSAGAKSNKINRYHLVGQGAEVALHNGIKKFSVAQNDLSTSLKKFKGRDSTQTNPNEQDDVVVNNKNPERQFAVLSRSQLAAVNALKKKKITEPQSRELAIEYANELPRLLATIKASEQAGIKDPPGFIISEMRNNKNDYDWEFVSNGWQTLNDFINEHLPKSPDDYQPSKPVGADRDLPDGLPDGLPDTPPYQYDQPIGPQPKLKPVNPKFQQQWDIAYNQIELQFDRSTFDTWLKGAKLITIDGDGKFVIGVRNGYVRDMLQHRLYRNIRRVLSDVTGKPAELRFEVVDQPKQISRDEDMPLFKLLAQEAS